MRSELPRTAAPSPRSASGAIWASRVSRSASRSRDGYRRQAGVGSAVLRIIEGDGLGSTHRVGGSSVGVVVGRGTGVRLAIDGDRRISTRHCRIWWDPAIAAHRLEDLSSRNGTWIDDVRLEPWRGVRLVSGDRIRIGRSVLEYVVADDLPSGGLVFSEAADRLVEGAGWGTDSSAHQMRVPRACLAETFDA